jgi:hypothetical protein
MKIAAVRQYALGLPDVAEEPHFRYSSFRVRGKIFVTVPPQETHVHVFVGEQHREPMLEMYPEFIDKLTWGAKTVGLRIALAKARPAVVRQLLRQAWESKAPKALLEKATVR